MRKFEIVKDEFIKYENKDITLPKRATKTAVGYDFYSPIDTVIKPKKSQLIWTNVKAMFESDVALVLAVTSGMGKNNITLANAIGVIESDYYGNISNDGNLGFRLYNFGEQDYVIKKDDKIGQGFFFHFLTVDNEETPTAQRVGGFGSTNK